MPPTHPLATFVVRTAAQLIAAGGAYQNATLPEVIDMVIGELGAAHGFFVADFDDEDTPPETMQ